MKKICNRILSVILCIMLIISLQQITFITSAASATTHFSPNKSEYTVGEEITVTIKFNVGVETYGIEGSLSYDNSIVKYVSGGANQGSYVKIAEAFSGETEVSVRVAFKTIAEGKCTFSFNGFCVDVNLEKHNASTGYFINVKNNEDNDEPEKPISFIAISSSPKCEYLQGESLALNIGKLMVAYTDGTYKISDITSDMVSGYNSNKIGYQTLTVTYNGYTAEFLVEVIEKQISFLSISSHPTKKEYEFGESLDLTGGEIALAYSDGSYELLDITEDMVTGYDAQKTGYQTLIVRHKGYSVEFKILVSLTGDLNSDEIVNLLDFVKLKKILAEVEQCGGSSPDIDKDGEITATDLKILMEIILVSTKNVDF